MTFVRTFEGYTPPDRYDLTPFTEARIQESALPESGFVTIDTIALSPVDADPTNPATRDLTTALATLEDAWYRIVWADADGSTFVTESVYFPSGSQPGALATTADVARILRSTIPSDQVSNVEAALEVATAWAKRYLGRPYEAAGGVDVLTSETDVPANGYIVVPGEPVSVGVVWYPGAAVEYLTASNWTYDGAGVRLRMTDDEWYDPRYSTTRLGRILTRVDIVSASPGTVDPVIRDGVAYAAAALWTRGPRLGKGFKGEQIGDYSYTLLESSSGDPFFEQAKTLLRPLRTQGPLVP